MEWVCWAGKEGERERLQAILAHYPLEGHTDYWHMVYRLLLTGRLAETRNLLAQHSAAASSMERVRLELGDVYLWCVSLTFADVFQY